jgi:hypothetical protein
LDRAVPYSVEVSASSVIGERFALPLIEAPVDFSVGEIRRHEIFQLLGRVVWRGRVRLISTQPMEHIFPAKLIVIAPHCLSIGTSRVRQRMRLAAERAAAHAWYHHAHPPSFDLIWCEGSIF